MLTILRRDDVPHALAGFYGQLAQAMTRDTFIGGEASRLFEGDARGRTFYLPPNSAANAMFLETLRYLLIQDWQDENRQAARIAAALRRARPLARGRQVDQVRAGADAVRANVVPHRIAAEPGRGAGAVSTPRRGRRPSGRCGCRCRRAGA